MISIREVEVTREWAAHTVPQPVVVPCCAAAGEFLCIFPVLGVSGPGPEMGVVGLLLLSLSHKHYVIQSSDGVWPGVWSVDSWY